MFIEVENIRYLIAHSTGTEIVARKLPVSESGAVSFFNLSETKPLQAENLTTDELNSALLYFASENYKNAPASEKQGKDGQRTAGKQPTDGKQTATVQLADRRRANEKRAAAMYALQFVQAPDTLAAYYENYPYLGALLESEYLTDIFGRRRSSLVRMAAELKNIPRPALRELEKITGEKKHSDFYIRLLRINAEVETVRMPSVVEWADRIVMGVCEMMFSK